MTPVSSFTANDESWLTEITEQLRDLCSHVSVRRDESGPFLIALGRRQLHTLNLRIAEGRLRLELWRGPCDSEELVRVELYDSPEDAGTGAKSWLRHDGA
jgi:hypothetical protein